MAQRTNRIKQRATTTRPSAPSGGTRRLSPTILTRRRTFPTASVESPSEIEFRRLILCDPEWSSGDGERLQAARLECAPITRIVHVGSNLQAGGLEAMSAGLCPVVSAVGGTPDVLGPELSHRLVPRGDHRSFVAAMAAALDEALENDEQRRSDGQLARKRVERAFGLTAMVRAYEALYDADDRARTGARSRRRATDHAFANGQAWT